MAAEAHDGHHGNPGPNNVGGHHVGHTVLGEHVVEIPQDV